MKLNVLVACKLLNSPFQSIVFWNIDCVSCWSIESWTLDVFRHWHIDIHVISNALLLVVTLHLYDESNFGIGGILNDYVHCEQRFHPNVQTITHQLELTIGGNESHQSLVLEPT